MNVDDPIAVYVMPGSQYAAKVLVALDARKIPHYSIFVDLIPKSRKLPSGGTLVPEIKCGPHIVADSEKIYHWLDENRGARLFPTPEASQLSLRASNGILSGAVLYYNWVFYKSYARSMQATFDRHTLPSFVFFFRKEVVDYFLQSERAKKKAESQSMMGEDVNLDDEFATRQLLIGELEFFQSLLKAESQPYLLAGTSEPTAVDFSVYVMVERLVGDMGDANVLPSLPDFLELSELERLWEWHKGMVERHPIKFKGKRKPKAP